MHCAYVIVPIFSITPYIMKMNNKIEYLYINIIWWTIVDYNYFILIIQSVREQIITYLCSLAIKLKTFFYFLYTCWCLLYFVILLFVVKYVIHIKLLKGILVSIKKKKYNFLLLCRYFNNKVQQNCILYPLNYLLTYSDIPYNSLLGNI